MELSSCCVATEWLCTSDYLPIACGLRPLDHATLSMQPPVATNATDAHTALNDSVAVHSLLVACGHSVMNATIISFTTLPCSHNSPPMPPMPIALNDSHSRSHNSPPMPPMPIALNDSHSRSHNSPPMPPMPIALNDSHSRSHNSPVTNATDAHSSQRLALTQSQFATNATDAHSSQRLALTQSRSLTAICMYARCVTV
jgi:hypothetical protein